MKLNTISLVSCVLLCACPADGDSGDGVADTGGSDSAGTHGNDGMEGTADGMDDAPDDGMDGPGDAADDAADDAPDDTGPDDGNDDSPNGTCQPVATRIIVLGDSIPACAGVGGANSGECAPRIFADRYAETYGATSYENFSGGGAVTANVANQQLGTVPTGMPGHALVVIYVGGNDLSPFLAGDDDAAVAGYTMLAPQLAASWDSIYAFFGDETNFPDGATILMNTQYDPFDGCTAAPYFVSQTKLGLLGEYNVAMAERADARDTVFVADQHTSYLGHGHHSGVASCPNYVAGSAGWMEDLIHPNVAGHANVADQMAVATEGMYVDCE